MPSPGEFDAEMVRWLPALPELYFSEHQLVFLVQVPRQCNELASFRLGSHELGPREDYLLTGGRLYFTLPDISAATIDGEISRSSGVRYRFRLRRVSAIRECAHSLKRQEMNYVLLSADLAASVGTRGGHPREVERVRNLLDMQMRRVRIAALDAMSEVKPLGRSEGDTFCAMSRINCRISLV